MSRAEGISLTQLAASRRCVQDAKMMLNSLTNDVKTEKDYKEAMAALDRMAVKLMGEINQILDRAE